MLYPRDTKAAPVDIWQFRPLLGPTMLPEMVAVPPLLMPAAPEAVLPATVLPISTRCPPSRVTPPPRRPSLPVIVLFVMVRSCALTPAAIPAGAELPDTVESVMVSDSPCATTPPYPASLELSDTVLRTRVTGPVEWIPPPPSPSLPAVLSETVESIRVTAPSRL